MIKPFNSHQSHFSSLESSLFIVSIIACFIYFNFLRNTTKCGGGDGWRIRKNSDLEGWCWNLQQIKHLLELGQRGKDREWGRFIIPFSPNIFLAFLLPGPDLPSPLSPIFHEVTLHVPLLQESYPFPVTGN